MSHKFETGGRRSGKSLAAAKVVAEAMRQGKTAATWSIEHGWEKIVSVPGFADGTQLPAPPKKTRAES
jgi:hypothetical protein